MAAIRLRCIISKAALFEPRPTQPNTALPITIVTAIATASVDSIGFGIPNSYPRQSPLIFIVFDELLLSLCGATGSKGLRL